MRTEGPLTGLLGDLCGLPLLHHFVDRERLTEQTLALRRLHRRTADLRIAHHDDGEPLRLATLGVVHEHSILDRHERRKQLSHLFDLDSRIEISHVDLEHRHGGDSRGLAEEHAGTPAHSRPDAFQQRQAKRTEMNANSTGSRKTQ